MHPQIAPRLDAFRPISLEALNAKAAMLERLDNKYIVPARLLSSALAAFASGFDVLDIGGTRAFGYATRYCDDAERRSYYDHHQGRRKRSKIRLRRYLDAGFSYLEVKLKDRRDVTVKKRLKTPETLEGLQERCAEFIDQCHIDLYGAPLGRDELSPSLAMSYKRLTLVAREGGERMTIDGGLRFSCGALVRPADLEMFIIETKSARGNGEADRILRALHLHPTPRCSKYCVGMAALGQVSRANRFLPALKRLGLSAPQAADVWEG